VYTLGSQCVYIDKIHKIFYEFYVLVYVFYEFYAFIYAFYEFYVCKIHKIFYEFYVLFYVFYEFYVFIYAFYEFYVFYQCKRIGIPTCTQHLLTLSAGRPNNDRFKKFETCSLVHIK